MRPIPPVRRRLPDTAEARTTPVAIDTSKMESPKIEPPKSRLGLARSGVRAFESMLMPRLRPAPDEDDAASQSVACLGRQPARWAPARFPELGFC